MKICTINIPELYLDDLEILVNMGFYPSRSEAVREALKRFLTKENIFVENLSKDKFHEMKNSQLETMVNFS